MKFINIFLASSIDEMKRDRIEFGNYIRTLNDRFVNRGLYIRLHMCEDISDDISLVRKQDDYNNIIKQCDYFYIMVWHRLGEYTKEEFDVALKSFRQNTAPRISTFFKDPEKNVDDSVTEFMEELDRGLNHYYTKFASVDSIKFKILMQITDSPDLSAKLEFKDSKLLIDGDCVGSINLKNLPFYSNHKNITTLKQSLAEIDEKIAEARAMSPGSPSGDIQELEFRRENIVSALHKAESDLLDTSIGFVRLETNGKKVTLRNKKAIALFDSGLVDEALAVLNEKDLAEDIELLSLARKSADITAEALLEECLSAVKMSKTKGLTEENIERIIRYYSMAWNIVRDNNLAPDCIVDYMWFLREQKRYNDAAELGEYLYYEFKRRKSRDPAVWSKYCCDLGILYRDINRTEEAEKLLTEALDIRRELASSDPEKHLPSLAYSYNSLGILYRLTDRIVDAENAYKEGYAIWDTLAKKDLKKYGGDKANICNNCAYLYLRSARFEEAHKLFNEAFAIRSELAKTDPEEHEVYLGRIYNNIGELYRLTGRFPEAEKSLLEGLRLRKESIKVNPINLTYTAGSSSSLGVLYAQLGDLEKSEKHFCDAIRIYRHRVEENFDSYASYLADNCADLGEVLRRTGRTDEAQKLLDEAMSIYRKLVGTNPLRYRAGLARVSILRALLYSTLGDEESALALFSDAYSFFSELAEKIPMSYVGPAVCALYNAACSLHLLGERTNAEKIFDHTLNFAGAYASKNKECADICTLIRSGSAKHTAPFPSHVFSK